MITDLWIENFKGIGKRQHIPLRPITLLFGENSAGKSSVLHALLYLREILDNLDCDPAFASATSKTTELGGFENLVHRDSRGFCSDHISIGCAIRLHPGELLERVPIDPDDLELFREKSQNVVEKELGRRFLKGNPIEIPKYNIAGQDLTSIKVELQIRRQQGSGAPPS